MDTSTEGQRRREQDLYLLRIAAWCVARDRYQAEPARRGGGHRGKARIVTLTFYLEQDDFAEADRAVRAIVGRRG